MLYKGCVCVLFAKLQKCCTYVRPISTRADGIHHCVDVFAGVCRVCEWMEMIISQFEQHYETTGLLHSDELEFRDRYMEATLLRANELILLIT